VQAALSALSLLHELLGFRFRKLMRRAKNAKETKGEIFSHTSRPSREIIFFVFIRAVRG